MIGNARLRPARDKRTVEYFLRMERANALVYSVRGVDDPIAEAIGIYKVPGQQCPVQARRSCILPLGLCAGEAVAYRTVPDGGHSASAKGEKACGRSLRSPEPSDELLNEGTWLKIEIAKQLGFCNYEMSRLPATPLQKRKKYLEDAIQETREAVSAARSIAAVPSEYDDNSLLTSRCLRRRAISFSSSRSAYGMEKRKLEMSKRSAN